MRRENFSRTRWERHFLQESQNVVSDNADTALKRTTVSFQALWRLWNDGSVLWEKLVCGLLFSERGFFALKVTLWTKLKAGVPENPPKLSKAVQKFFSSF